MKSKVHPTYKTKYRVANWAAYNQALVRRGDVTVWVSAKAIAAWTPRWCPAASATMSPRVPRSLAGLYGWAWARSGADHSPAARKEDVA